MGNIQSNFATIGARNYAHGEREAHDFYATPSDAVEKLLEIEHFTREVWEPCCGKGHISDVLARHGYLVRSTDLYDYGYGESGVDFLAQTGVYDVDIITNPPYDHALDFVRKAIALVGGGHKVAMLLRIQFLEGKERGGFFRNSPPRTVYVSRSRITCAKNADFEAAKNGTAMCFCWFVWEKGWQGDPVIKWFN